MRVAIYVLLLVLMASAAALVIWISRITPNNLTLLYALRMFLVITPDGLIYGVVIWDRAMLRLDKGHKAIFPCDNIALTMSLVGLSLMYISLLLGKNKVWNTISILALTAGFLLGVMIVLGIGLQHAIKREKERKK